MSFSNLNDSLILLCVDEGDVIHSPKLVPFYGDDVTDCGHSCNLLQTGKERG